MIPYVTFDVRFFGLEMADDAELELFRQRVEKALRDVPVKHGRIALEGDIEVEVIEHAGKCDGEHAVSVKMP